MKLLLILSFLFFAACAVDPATATSDQALICGHWCDPESTDQIMEDATRFGESLFIDATATGESSCGTTAGGETTCSAGFATCELSCVGGARCCQYIAWCTPSQCGWYR